MQNVIKKLKFRNKGVILNTPPAIEKEFVKEGFKKEFDKKIKSTNTLVFINNKSEYLNFLKSILKDIEHDSVLWFAYPKGLPGSKQNQQGYDPLLFNPTQWIPNLFFHEKMKIS
ncbi:MAG: hypothetical protein ABI415_10975 [Flavitalea sp.]